MDELPSVLLNFFSLKMERKVPVLVRFLSLSYVSGNFCEETTLSRREKGRTLVRCVTL